MTEIVGPIKVETAEPTLEMARDAKKEEPVAKFLNNVGRSCIISLSFVRRSRWFYRSMVAFGHRVNNYGRTDLWRL